MKPSFVDPKNLPHKPGIYIYKDKAGKVIYVGKAIDLEKRVSSYFSGRPHDAKTSHLVNNIASLETIVVESELEALILEANLIKKYLPLYNIRLTDDKDYLYIGITKEDFPRVITARKPDLKSLKKYFGPYPSSRTVKQTLKQLRRVFPWCSNPPKKEIAASLTTFASRNDVIARPRSGEAISSRMKPCFYYHIGQCPGACVGEISKQDYNKILNRFSKFLGGQKEELLKELTDEMEKWAKKEKFEEAGQIKRIITGIQYLTQPNRVSSYLENPNFLEDQNELALEELKRDLHLEELPERIEGYDISNIQGKEATGSMVVLTHGEIDKSQYRRFKIKITGKPNDYAMHAEMMRRRLGHPEWGIPQLILIDGGRGQVRAVKDVIAKHTVISTKGRDLQTNNLEISRSARNDNKTNLNEIPIYGLAKRMEWLYPPEGEVVKLPKRSLSLRLLQKIRGESHRFAITYHRKLRSKAFLG